MKPSVIHDPATLVIVSGLAFWNEMSDCVMLGSSMSDVVSVNQ